MQLNIKYFSDKISKLCYIDGSKSDWVDLRSAEEVHLKAGEFYLLPLGIGIALPEGYEAYIVPRSSSFKRYGFIQTNSIGVVDESYCGDEDQWLLPIYAVRDVDINVDDRVAQFRLFKHQPEIEFCEVPHLGEVSRGSFGSTGRV